MSTVIIIGNGPAGISAALYTQRANIDTIIIGKDNGALEKAHAIENYYGLSDILSGNELANVGNAQALKLGCTMIDEEVMAIAFDGKLSVKTKLATYNGDVVIIATGAARNTPNIKGLKGFEGKGVSYCAVCDAFFYRQKDVCVLGNGEYALHEALELLPVVGSVTMLTNGLDPTVELPSEIKCDKRKITSFNGESTIGSVSFESGESIQTAGVFVAVGVASSSDLAKKLGAEVNGNNIVVNENMETNIPGMFAAGDCTGGLLQVAKAVYEGAKAGTSAIKYIRSL
ncbi:MAG: NAD(P)/FAD-dependent oxidoreductase [Oscillospiraceae bacterium]